MIKLPEKKSARIALLVTAIVLIVAIAVGATLLIMSLSERRADKSTLDRFIEQYGIITPEERDGYDVYAYQSDSIDVHHGFILYPDAMTDPDVYAPLATLMAKKGITVFVIDMPLNQPTLDKDAADRVIAENPNVEEWYIGGHGKGGMAAADYVADDADMIDGIVFLASYSTADLSSLDIRSYSMYGSEDGIMDIDEYHECKENLPEGSEEYKIVGCNYSGFAIYEKRSGDGDPAPNMDNIRQVLITAQRVSTFILGE